MNCVHLLVYIVTIDFIFSTIVIWNISHFKNNWAQYYHKCTWCLCKVPIIPMILIKCELFWQIFKKCWNAKFHENLSSRGQVVLCGRQTDRHDKLIAAFSNFANVPKNDWSYISIPPYIVMTWYIIKEKENFICTFMVCLITLWVAQTV